MIRPNQEQAGIIADLERQLSDTKKERDDFQFKAAQLTLCLRASAGFIATLDLDRQMMAAHSTARHCLEHNAVEHTPDRAYAALISEGAGK